MHTAKRRALWALGALGLLAVCAGLALAVRQARAAAPHTAVGYAMDTVVTQTAYGPHGEAAAAAVTRRLAGLETSLSMYVPGSDIAAIGAAAGIAPAPVGQETFALLQRALALGGQARGAFAVTVAPLTRLWNVTAADAQLPAAADIAAALALVGDDRVILDAAAGTVYLPQAGQGVDLGGIAKGYACDAARAAYLAAGVQSGVVSIGGNVCAVGAKPDGTPFRVGFRDPAGGEQSYIASFLLQDGVAAVSGGYERYFEADGVRYHHILDVNTGWPVQSDLASVGVVTAYAQWDDAGTLADFWSTTLYCWGLQQTLDFMRTAPFGVVALDNAGRLYVSACLAGGFVCEDENTTVIVVEGVGTDAK